MYIGFTTKFRSGGGLYEKHVVATWHLGDYLSICSWTQGNQEKPVSRWPVAGPSGPCLVGGGNRLECKTGTWHVLRHTCRPAEPTATQNRTVRQSSDVAVGRSECRFSVQPKRTYRPSLVSTQIYLPEAKRP